jgi:hypothetical protein
MQALRLQGFFLSGALWNVAMAAFLGSSSSNTNTNTSRRRIAFVKQLHAAAAIVDTEDDLSRAATGRRLANNIILQGIDIDWRVEPKSKWTTAK